jgi:hypothetical protein
MASSWARCIVRVGIVVVSSDPVSPFGMVIYFRRLTSPDRKGVVERSWPAAHRTVLLLVSRAAVDSAPTRAGLTVGCLCLADDADGALLG